MSEIYGLLGLEDSDRSFINTIGQEVVYDAVQQEIDRLNSEVNAALGLFVEKTTEAFKFRYKLPAGGYMPRRGTQAAPGLVKSTGSWDVGMPLFDFGDEVGGDDVSLAYMRLDELNRHIDNIEIRNKNTIRREIMVAMFNSVQFSFEDDIHGTIEVEGLANGDTVVYPPLLGAAAGATENHYLLTAFTVANIPDTNDPVEDAIDELEEHFGSPTGGSEIAFFAGKALCDKIADTLTDFEDVADMHVEKGADSDTVIGLPDQLIGYKVRGRHRDGAWVVEYRYIPDDYSVTIHLEAPRPLILRVDPADTGRGQGLQLVSRQENTPLESAFYRNRYGMGVGNRLNGVVQKYAASGSYSVPTAYAR